jgi:hypothetical protein
MQTASRRWAMWGALLVRRLPGAGQPSAPLEQQPQGLFLLWLAYMGLLSLGAVLLWQHGVWHRLLRADPTGLTMAIVLLFVACSLWAGHRAWLLGQQFQALHSLAAPAVGDPPSGWAQDYLQGRRLAAGDRAVWQQLLSEQAHGPHEMAWWLNGIQLKLGLLGKVIGFSILALELGQMESFDPQQSARLLKSLTGGLGIALLTTITGLAGNILLGLQLMRLDRFADALVAQALRLGEERTLACA